MTKNDPIININPSFKGFITVNDLLKSEATIALVLEIERPFTSGHLFEIIDKDFYLAFKFDGNHAVFSRNKSNATLDLSDLISGNSQNMIIFVMWTHNSLKIAANNGKIAKVQTNPTVPPTKLIRWARQQTLIPSQTYKTAEAFREKIHSCFETINPKIKEADMYKSFWNIEYDGQKIISRKPKTEPEIQPIIHGLLSDQMLVNGIEIIPEFKTGSGNLDFLFIGSIEGSGSEKFCAEFKLAHSKDLHNGLWHQLPEYMLTCNAEYGAYCVLNFKCEWFDEPDINENDLSFNLSMVPADKIKAAHHLNIRNFIFDMGKPITASKLKT